MIGADTTFLVQLELVELAAHQSAHALLQREVLQPQIPLALAPQVLAEFLHVVTDPRRFQKPLTMNEALAKARFWWNAREVPAGLSNGRRHEPVSGLDATPSTGPQAPLGHTTGGHPVDGGRARFAHGQSR